MEVPKNCDVCFQLLFRTAHFPCRHFLCRHCYLELTEDAQSPTCPFCRKRIAKNLGWDEEEDKRCKTSNPEEHSKRVAQLSSKFVKLIIGNTCSPPDQNDYREWTLYLKSGDPSIPLTDMIEKAEVHLHPTFRPPSVVLGKDFKLTRRGWGTFTIRVGVTWRKQFKKGSEQFEYYLSFSEDSQQSFKIKNLN